MILVQMVRKILSFTVIVAVSLLLFLPASTDWGEPDGKKRLPDFTFLRLIYSGEGWRGWGWATDYPKADQQFLYGLQKLSDFTFVSSEHKALKTSHRWHRGLRIPFSLCGGSGEYDVV